MVYKQIIDIIKSGQNFLVASHAHPDGDGIGSTIALAKGIEGLGKNAVMFNADNVPFNLKFLPYSDKIVNKLNAGQKFDATFLVDCAQLARVEGDASKLSKVQLGKTVLIDHHIMGQPEFDLCCVDADAAATGEVIFRLLKIAGTKITPQIATNLFCTFVVDSGSFRYSNTTPVLLRDAAELITAGANPWAISMAMDESNSPSYIKLLRLVLATFEQKNNTAWIILTQQMFKEAGAALDVAEEFINFPRSITGIEVAILFRELPSGKWKVSFRSKDKVDVRKIAAKFDGGGHSHAAGCTLEGDLATVKAQILATVTEQMGE